MNYLNCARAPGLRLQKKKIDQVQKGTISQSSGANFFKHRAGRIGASQSKAAAHSDPALPSQSLIQRICYPELHKVNTKAVRHGCKHEVFSADGRNPFFSPFLAKNSYFVALIRYN